MYFEIRDFFQIKIEVSVFKIETSVFQLQISTLDKIQISVFKHK